MAIGHIDSVLVVNRRSTILFLEVMRGLVLFRNQFDAVGDVGHQKVATLYFDGLPRQSHLSQSLENIVAVVNEHVLNRLNISFSLVIVVWLIDSIQRVAHSDLPWSIEAIENCVRDDSSIVEESFWSNSPANLPSSGIQQLATRED